MKNTILVVIVTAIIFGGAAFYGGMLYAKSTNKGLGNFRDFSGANAGGARPGNGAGRGTGQNGGFASGDIISKDDKSITVKMRDGGSKIIFLSDKTEVGKFTGGALSDLEIGKTVTITGAANSDGSITAQSIQIRPEMLNPNPNNN